MRKGWMEGGLNMYYIKAFFYVFMMQGVFSLIVNSASLYVCIWSADDKLIFLDYIAYSLAGRLCVRIGR